MGHRAAVPAERLIAADLCETPRLDHALMLHRIEAVVHFAAFAFVGESVTDPAKYYQNNLVNTLNLLDALRRHKIGRIVFSSTCATYGVPGKSCPSLKTKSKSRSTPTATPSWRSNTPWPITPPPTTGASPPCATSTPPAPRRTAASARTTIRKRTSSRWCCKRCWDNGRPSKSSVTDYPTPDGTCVRDYIHVDDLAEAHLLALESAGAGEAAALQPGDRPRLQRARGDRRRRGSDGQESPGEGGAAPPRRSAGAGGGVGKGAARIGWRPKYTDLRSVVETAWKWHKTHPKGYED